MKSNAKDIYNYCFKNLSSIEESERRSLIHILLEDYYGLSKLDIALKKEIEYSKNVLDKQLKRLQSQEPIQHIVGFTYFRDRKFAVSSNVLIPRPETEELIDLVISNNTVEQPSILDVGTGSGCIAISLALELKKAKVQAIDLSKKAIALATKNATALNTSVEFIENDFLSYESETNYDIIVSNPPYIRNLEKQDMEANVLDFEPEMALFVEDDEPLIFYRAIAKMGLKNLKPKGFIVVEINSFLGKETESLFKNLGYAEVELIQDFYEKDRFVLAKT